MIIANEWQWGMSESMVPVYALKRVN